MTNHLFPINFSGSWFSQNEPKRCSAHIASWLYDQDSLTQKLARFYSDFQIKIRQQKTIYPTTVPFSVFFSNETSIFVREVFLHCDGLPVVFAQTEIPLSTSSQIEEKLTELGTESLGTILFENPNIKRGEIEIAQFSQNSQLVQSIEQDCSHSLWARRSLFYVNATPLLVSELFLPASGIYTA